jgi:hypothetical protein
MLKDWNVSMPENPSEDLSVTEHVRQAWRFLINLPDGNGSGSPNTWQDAAPGPRSRQAQPL